MNWRARVARGARVGSRTLVQTRVADKLRSGQITRRGARKALLRSAVRGKAHEPIRVKRTKVKRRSLARRAAIVTRLGRSLATSTGRRRNVLTRKIRSLQHGMRLTLAHHGAGGARLSSLKTALRVEGRSWAATKARRRDERGRFAVGRIGPS